jgi:hypothetical protein
MVRVQLQLTGEQARRLRREAREQPSCHPSRSGNLKAFPEGSRI